MVPFALQPAGGDDAADAPAAAILLIDDDDAARDAIAAFLAANGLAAAGLGWTPATADRVAGIGPAVLILDTLRHHDAALALIRRHAAAGTGVIVLTELDDPSERVLALELGATITS